MASTPPSPQDAHLTHALANQVGGHSGVQTTEDNTLIIKPALPLEHEFYSKVSNDPDLDVLLPYIPKFFGTLKLQGEETAEGVVATTEHKDMSLAVQCATL